jgi:hypothetical protein
VERLDRPESELVDEMATVGPQYLQRAVPAFCAFRPHHDEAMSRQQFALILLRE